MDSGSIWVTTSMLLISPWQLEQPTPAPMWTLWSKFAYSGTLWTRIHSTGCPLFMLSRITASFSLSRSHHLMAVHAHLRGRHRSDRGDLDLSMAVAAIELELSRVQLVTERDRLHRLIADVGELRGEVVPDQNRHHDERPPPTRRPGRAAPCWPSLGRSVALKSPHPAAMPRRPAEGRLDAPPEVGEWTSRQRRANGRLTFVEQLFKRRGGRIAVRSRTVKAVAGPPSLAAGWKMDYHGTIG